MKKCLLFVALVSAALAAVSPPSDASLRRRAARACCPPPPCPPVVYCYAAPRIVYVAPPMMMTLPPPGVVQAPPRAPTRTVVINGKTYALIDTGERDEKEDEVEKEKITAVASDIPDSERYKGKSRRVAKTTIFAGEAKTFDSLADLIAFLPANETMVALEISRAPASKRVEQEQQNVTVTAWLYAFKKEPDRDYHVILGEAPSVPAAQRAYLNVEVSGIPADGTANNRNQLWNVRKTFQSRLQLGASGPSRYVRLDPPVPVRVTGSLFWDVDHEKPPYVGPSTHKPKTPWEIHPVSQIEFLP